MHVPQRRPLYQSSEVPMKSLPLHARRVAPHDRRPPGLAVAVLAKKGEKNFKRGMQYEQAQQWEKAAQEFALAWRPVISDTEYQLHYRRAVFNASQTFMTKGNALAEQGRLHRRLPRLPAGVRSRPRQRPRGAGDERRSGSREKEGSNARTARATRPRLPRFGQRPQRAIGRRGAAQRSEADARRAATEIQWNGDHEGSSKLADELGLNVVFDQNFAQVKRTVNIRWKE